MSNKVGDRFINRHGTEVEIVKLLENSVTEVVVVGTDITLVMSRGRLKSFKTPICRTVYGVGYIGIGEFVCRDETGKITPEYSAWSNMIKRCYTEYKGNRSKQAYENTFVCEEWLNYQNFAKWYKEVTKKFIDNGIIPKIDKDLFSSDDRGTLYSPETCCVLPNIINCTLVQKRSTNSIHNGVVKDGNKFNCSVMHEYKPVRASFSSEEDAIDFYKQTKKENIRRLAEKFKHVLDENVYNKLMNWEWRSNDN